MPDDLDLAAMRAAAERLVAANAAMNPPPRLHKKAMDAMYERDDARRDWWNMVHDPARALALLERLRAAEADVAKLRRFLRVSRDEGTEALENAARFKEERDAARRQVQWLMLFGAVSDMEEEYLAQKEPRT